MILLAAALTSGGAPASGGFWMEAFKLLFSIVFSLVVIWLVIRILKQE